jgi:ubiquinone/menaquinone biosynthesis C-methylase UbiE
MICTAGRCNIPQDFIDEFSKEYRKMLRPEWIGVSHGVRDLEYATALYYAPLDSDDVILDVGCGESGFGIYASRRVAESWGVDDGSWKEFYDRWVETLPEIPECQSGAFSFAQINARHLPFSDATFDKVFTFSAFEHFAGEDDVKASREVARVLKPGGVFAGTVDFKAATKNPVEGYDAYTLDEFRGRIVDPSGLALAGETSIGDMSPETITSLFFLLEKRDEDMGQNTEG